MTKNIAAVLCHFVTRLSLLLRHSSFRGASALRVSPSDRVKFFELAHQQIQHKPD